MGKKSDGTELPLLVFCPSPPVLFVNNVRLPKSVAASEVRFFLSDGSTNDRPPPVKRVWNARARKTGAKLSPGLPQRVGSLACGGGYTYVYIYIYIYSRLGLTTNPRNAGRTNVSQVSLPFASVFHPAFSGKEPTARGGRSRFYDYPSCRRRLAPSDCRAHEHTRRNYMQNGQAV